MRLRLGILATALTGMMLGSPVEANASQAANKIAEIFNVIGAEAIPPQVVIWRHPQYKRGDVVVSTTHRRLYYVLGRGQAIEYGVGVGRTGFTWSGVKTVTRKREWPDWTPPTAMMKRRPDIPHHMVGGVDNPLGARALYLGSSEYRIHGSNEQDTIGTAVSSGCIRMTNRDVVDLYNRVKVGTKVVVLD